MRSIRIRDALLPAAIALLLAALWGAIRPSGDFPLNDDWQYAHVAKRLAETGRFVVDVPVAPTLALQSAAGVPAAEIDGGFEVNGWLEYEGEPPRAPKRTCGRRTRWNCFDLDYAISFAAPPGSEVVMREPVADWLGVFPDLLLVRRPAAVR